MQDVRGERFFVDLGDDETADSLPPAPAAPAAPGSAFALVSDVLERPPGASSSTPPAPPKPRSAETGFPAHRKRTKQSAFKKQQQLRADDGSGPSDARSVFEEADRLRIDQENKQKIDSMSPEEIEKERQELFSGLSPALIQRLLSRPTLDDQPSTEATINVGDISKTETSKTVSFAEADADNNSKSSTGVDIEKLQAPQATAKDNVTDHTVDEAGPAEPVLDFSHNTHIEEEVPSSSIHFPKPPEPPDLDPTSETFLDDLHEKYFPNLSHDPQKLSWMQPADEDDDRSPYHPSHLSLPAAALRFNFKGQLLPPRLARQVPVSAGLHHHGDAPEAAGYTVPELAHLARSSNAPQRCVAYQTLGRILYRLGAGEFGREDDELEEVRALSRGLWDCVEETKVVQVMAMEAAREKGHLSARAYAQEALWNWRKGGGRKRRAQ